MLGWHAHKWYENHTQKNCTGMDYQNYSHMTFIRRIFVDLQTKALTFYSNNFYDFQKTFKEELDQFLKKEQYYLDINSEYRGVITVSCKSENNLKIIIKFFQYITVKYKQDQSEQKQIEVELNNFYFYKGNFADYKFSFPQNPKIYTHINPKYRKSNRITNAMLGYRRWGYFRSFNLFKKEVNRLLMMGEDPNQISENADTPLIFLVNNFDELTFKEKQSLCVSFVRRGADAFSRLTGYGKSAFENCFDMGLFGDKVKKLEFATIFSSLTMHIERPIMNKVKKVERRVQPGKMVASRLELGQMSALFTYENGAEFLIESRHAETLMPEELLTLFPIFRSCFKDPDGDEKRLSSNFKYGFEQPGKMVSLIYHHVNLNKKLVGAVTTLKIDYPELNHRSIATPYAFVDNNYGSYGFMPLLTTFVAFCLPLVVRKKELSAYYVALGFASFALTGRAKDNFLLVPLYYSEKMTHLLKKGIFPQSDVTSIYSDDGPMLVAENEPVQLAVSDSKPDATDIDRLTYTMIVGEKEGKLGIPMLIPIILSNFIAYKMKINMIDLNLTEFLIITAAHLYISGLYKLFTTSDDIINNSFTRTLDFLVTKNEFNNLKCLCPHSSERLIQNVMGDTDQFWGGFFKNDENKKDSEKMGGVSLQKQIRAKL
jgi:hypothetical protein